MTNLQHFHQVINEKIKMPNNSEIPFSIGFRSALIHLTRLVDGGAVPELHKRAVKQFLLITMEWINQQYDKEQEDRDLEFAIRQRQLNAVPTKGE